MLYYFSKLGHIGKVEGKKVGVKRKINNFQIYFLRIFQFSNRIFVKVGGLLSKNADASK